MRQSGHYSLAKNLTQADFGELLEQCIEEVDIGQAKKEALPFVRQPETLDVWSKEFFREIVKRVEFC